MSICPEKESKILKYSPYLGHCNISQSQMKTKKPLQRKARTDNVTKYISGNFMYSVFPQNFTFLVCSMGHTGMSAYFMFKFFNSTINVKVCKHSVARTLMARLPRLFELVLESLRTDSCIFGII